jgi:hypothetical protein
MSRWTLKKRTKSAVVGFAGILSLAIASPKERYAQAS